jgi:hypothetical protein
MKKITTVLLLLITSSIPNKIKLPSIEHPTMLTHFHAMAHTVNLSKEWGECITKVRLLDNPKLKRQFTRIVYRMKEFSLFSLWLKNSFEPIWKKENGNGVKFVQSLYESFKPSKHIFSELSYKRQRITTQKKTSWNQYKKEVIDYFLSSKISPGQKEEGINKSEYNFQKTFHSLDEYAKLASLQVMKTLLVSLENTASLLSKNKVYAKKIKIKIKQLASQYKKYRLEQKEKIL